MSEAQTMSHQAHALDDRSGIEAKLRDLDERVLILEAQLRQPMSTADRMIAERTAERRYKARFSGPGS
jgi:hypothetical protein